jgi:hypothetical protein
VLTPDGRRLVTLNEDVTVLIWGLAPSVVQGPDAKPDEMNRLWEDLAAHDGSTIYRAVWKLTAEPTRGVEVLRARLPAAVRATTKRSESIRSLLADLDSDVFNRREAASRALADLGAEAGMAIHQALARRPSPEARKRLEELLPRVAQAYSGESVRILRSLEILERIGTGAARHVLEQVAEASPASWLQEESARSLARLADRGAQVQK